MRKAFTLSETLIALAVIGVIAAILIPVLNNVKPEKERVLYKKALYTLQDALSVAMNDSSSAANNSSDYTSGADYWSGVSSTEFCEAMADALNTVGSAHCGAGDGTFASTDKYPTSDPNFVTINGARWWGFSQKQFDKNTQPEIDILVDVDGTGGKNNAGVDLLRIRMRYDGRVSTDDNWSTENEYLSDATKIHKGEGDK